MLKTVLDEVVGEARLRIVTGGDSYRGNVTLAGKQSETFEDADFERLRQRLRNEAGRLHPDYFGFEGAIQRFLQFFENGFRDSAYVAMERGYKLAAQQKLLSALPLDAASLATPEQAAQVRKAFYTNVLSQFELARMHAVLTGPTGPAFVRGAAKFATGAYGAGIAAMIEAIRPHGRASWPMITYLPNLWLPAEHMFLKPEKTKDFARRTGHRFAIDYEASLEPAVYLSLLDLVDETERQIRHLEPRDRIDVQSFIWVVGDYKDAQHEEVAQVRRRLAGS
jgi:hypothetical protein